MAYASTTRISTARPADRFQGIIASLRAAIERRRIHARTLQELRQLSDRELSDLGISRHSIAEVAREAAYGK